MSLQSDLSKFFLTEKLEDSVARHEKSLNVKIVQSSFLIDGAHVDGPRMAVSNGRILVTEYELSSGQVILIPNLVKPKAD